MTQSAEPLDLERSASVIAERGREALITRLRDAYRDATAAHADILHVDEDRIEAMVQQAAQRADGLQWRRALASAGALELDIPIAQALTHPTVQRAGDRRRPSYETSLAALSRGTVTPSRPGQEIVEAASGTTALTAASPVSQVSPAPEPAQAERDCPLAPWETAAPDSLTPAAPAPWGREEAVAEPASEQPAGGEDPTATSDSELEAAWEERITARRPLLLQLTRRPARPARAVRPKARRATRARSAALRRAKPRRAPSARPRRARWTTLRRARRRQARDLALPGSGEPETPTTPDALQVSADPSRRRRRPAGQSTDRPATIGRGPGPDRLRR